MTLSQRRATGLQEDSPCCDEADVGTDQHRRRIAAPGQLWGSQRTRRRLLGKAPSSCSTTRTSTSLRSRQPPSLTSQCLLTATHHQRNHHKSTLLSTCPLRWSTLRSSTFLVHADARNRHSDGCWVNQISGEQLQRGTRAVSKSEAASPAVASAVEPSDKTSEEEVQQFFCGTKSKRVNGPRVSSKHPRI